MVDNIFGIHAQMLKLRAERAQVLASNLANAETPGYRARDLNVDDVFSGLLNNQMESLNRTNPEHYSGNDDSGFVPHLQYRVQVQPSLDGNTVNMEQERSAFMQNALMYQASLQFINGRVSGLLTAIRGE